MHVLLRQGDVAVAEILRRVELNLLEAHDLADHLDLPVLHDRRSGTAPGEGVDDPDVGVGHGVGVVVHIDLADIGGLPLQIELIHMILL